MPPAEDHLLLDRCSVEINTIFARLYERVFAYLDRLDAPALTPQQRNEIGSALGAARTDLLDATVNSLRLKILSDADWQAERKSQFRELRLERGDD